MQRCSGEKEQITHGNESRTLTHTNITRSSSKTCWSLSTEQSWSSDNGCKKTQTKMWLSQMMSFRLHLKNEWSITEENHLLKRVVKQIWETKCFFVIWAAVSSPCLCLEGKWRHLLARSLFSHIGRKASLWWAVRKGSAPRRHYHQAGRHSNSRLPSHSVLLKCWLAPGSEDTIGHSKEFGGTCQFVGILQVIFMPVHPHGKFTFGQQRSRWTNSGAETKN